MKRPFEELKCPRLRELREEKRLTGYQLARLAGVTESCISLYETRGIERAATNRLLAIARALETTPEYLLGFSAEKHPAPMRVEFKSDLTVEQETALLSSRVGIFSLPAPEIKYPNSLRDEIIRRIDRMSVIEKARLLTRLCEGEAEPGDDFFP